MKKVFVSALTLAAVLCMFGCGAQQADSNQKDNGEKPEQKEVKTAEIGEAVPISTNYGDLEVTVEAFEDNAKASEFMLKYNHVKDTQHIGLLKLVVNNISYENINSSMPDYVDLSPVVYVTGQDGININAMNSAIDVDEYKAAAGAFFECPKGQSMRIATFHQIDAGLESVIVHIGECTVSVPVSAA